MWGHFAYSGASVIVRLGPKMGKLYAMRKYVESFRHRDEETPAAAAMQLSDIHTAQEEGIQQQEIEKKSAHPKTSQGELSSKKLHSKN